MKILPAHFSAWELLLIPFIATLAFSVNLIYFTIVLSDGNALFKEIRDSDFPVLTLADKNINRYEAIVVALNAAATTGELDFLTVAKGHASEVLSSYESLDRLDAKHRSEIEKLRTQFRDYFGLAMDIAQQVAAKSSTPNLQQISKMRLARELYLTNLKAYRDTAEKEFQAAATEAIRRSEHAKLLGVSIGMLMLLVIAALTHLVRRDMEKRARIEAILHESEEASRIAATAFETQDAIVITDADTNIIRVNRAFCAITGYSAEEVLGKKPSIMSSGKYDKSFYAEMWHQLLHTGAWAGEIWDKHRTGYIYPKAMTISAVKNKEGKTTHYVSIFRDITARKQAEEEINHLAFYDALTTLPNRRLFLERLQAALATSARHKNFGAVLFIDLDRFKLLNDTLGHDYGDLLLVEVGVRIKACIREMDTAGRFGGDEFLVLIEAVSDEQGDAKSKAATVAEKIREALSQPYKLREHEHLTSPSIGVCIYRGNDEPYEALIEHADMAMYLAKKSGRNAVRFYDHSRWTAS